MLERWSEIYIKTVGTLVVLSQLFFGGIDTAYVLKYTVSYRPSYQRMFYPGRLDCPSPTPLSR